MQRNKERRSRAYGVINIARVPAGGQEKRWAGTSRQRDEGGTNAGREAAGGGRRAGRETNGRAAEKQQTILVVLDLVP